MRRAIPILGVLLAAATALVVWKLVRPEGSSGTPARTPVSLSAEEVRVLAMDELQRAVARQMRIFVGSGEFTSDVRELGSPASFVLDDGVGGQGVVALEVCEGRSVVVLATTAADGSVFAVKARGLEPHGEGGGEFSHYTADPSCDGSRGPAAWPGGYEVSRGGLRKGGKPADIPLS